uniref:Laminin subunit alpha 3 n=1 Tax=Scleropages formosus TaxID=113540 RepID=A0A8C9TNF6_SCLFO
MASSEMRSRLRCGRAALLLLLTASLVRFARAPVPGNEVTGFSLSPPYFNLAEGARISASATCGEDERGGARTELYCKLVGGPTTGPPSQTIQGQFCDYCNSNDPDRAHPASNAIDGTERWWQSPPLSKGLRYNEVNVTLDLGQLFHVAYVLIKFANSPRPELWVLERSVDFGRTYSPWQYFAHLKRECIETFGKPPNGRIVRDDDQICTTEYSRIVPLENGEIVVSLVNGRPGATNFTYSPLLRDFTKATNIRLRFLRTSTLLGHLISKAQRDPTVTRRYYYSIKDISVGGRCVCHGHAQVCGFRCECQHNTCGESCDRCCPGFNQKPWRAATSDSANECQPCQCHSHATDCYYDPEVDRRRASLNIYGQYEGGGVCIHCQHNTAGVNCERCAKGYYRPYGVPRESPTGCRPCRCDPRTSAGCEDGSGRCICLLNFSGADCERCADGHHTYPLCILLKPLVHMLELSHPISAPLSTFPACNCDSTGAMDQTCGPRGQCRCHSNYAGLRCDQCAPGHYGFPSCVPCQCSPDGVYEVSCEPVSGRCLCRPGVIGRSCDRCALGGLIFPNCGGCQCDVGGAVGTSCDEHSGEPEMGFYVPDLHHMRFEVEDGSTPNARPVRFGYNPQHFPDFSWRGYATMSEAQEEVRLTVHVAETGPSQFLFVLRFVNRGTTSVTGRITAHHIRTGKGSGLSKEVTLPPSPRPAFLTVPGNGFAEPFLLSPGKWIIHIRAVGVLLDYLVLVPSTYYEASILQERVTEPCTYLAKPEKADRSCLLYRHVPMDGFPSALASLGVFYPRRRRARQVRLLRPTPLHPEMASVSGQQAQLRLTLRVPEPGRYALILEYASEVDALQNVDLLVDSQAEARVNIYSCTYSFLCRSVAVDKMNRVATFQLSHRSDILLQAPAAFFLLVSGTSTNPTRSGCICSSLISCLQSEISFSARVPATGLYVFLVQFLQPEHLSFPLEVLVDGGRSWPGSINASFCPHVSGCRDLVIAERRIALDVLQPELTVTLRVPRGKTLTLDYILVVPDESYTPELIREKLLDKSSDFINQCGADSFYIDPSSASRFCRDSARSLALFASDGALPCGCHSSGATSPTCEPLGGQCPCRPHVIGRQCTRCATGYYGFPYCRRCECGRRLCDEVTGQCICPPQTVRPSCDVCESQTFSYHPLLGCEGCDCSPTGVSPYAGLDCDRTTGQCTCKPRIAGRQCDRCAPGYYGFPECAPCSCNPAGVKPDICHPESGSCLCKRNVVGSRCDACRAGSFHFDAMNPDGCTTCFCFGATEQCRSSEHRRGKFVNMQSWRLEMPDREEVPSVFNSASNTVVADVQELPALVHNLHWVAPPSYLGDKVSSYGGFLTYQLKSFGIPSEGMVLLDRRPDILLHGHHMTLEYLDPHAPSPDRLYQGRVQLVEGSFRHAGTKRPVSREEFVMVLAGLGSLRIRGLYFAQSQRLSLGEVGLEEVSASGSGGAASAVEVCTCPPEYRGDSCQKCAPGYYRERNGHYLGRCLPCSCNGLSNECDEATGRCLNCQYNSAGDHCERCLEGYYGDAARRTCQPCPCPYSLPSNSFATGCRVFASGLQCFCKAGYTGSKCERCAPGYYGEPTVLGGSCRPCNCNGNPSSCDPRTGGDLVGRTKMSETLALLLPAECDSCVKTLLDDLDRLDELLLKLKLQLESANSSSAAWDRLKKLEDEITATKVPLALLLCCYERLADLLKQLNGSDSNSGVPSKDLARMLADAQRMVQEMETRSCADQLTAAEKEREEAQKLLDYIKNNVTNQHEKNQAAASRISGLLKDYESKLKDLERVLKEAEDTVKKAKRQNGLNDAALEELQVKFPLFSLRYDASCHAEQPCYISETQEYEQLAAQLDGAKTDLTKKVNLISTAASKEDIVERAEKHAEILSQLAKDLQEAVRNASGSSDVRAAIDAIDAYKNITEAIRAAEEAAGQAKEAADAALKVSCAWAPLHLFVISGHRIGTNTHTHNHKLFWPRTPRQIRAVIMKNITSTIPSLLDKISKVENLTTQLPSNNVSENIRRIKELIELARDAANRIVVPMKFSGDGYVELRAPRNVEDLRAFTSLSLSLQRPESTNGRGDGRRKRQQATDTGNMFVLYLGNKNAAKDYMGMVLRGNKLFYIYRLNGVENEIESDYITKSVSEPALFDRVDLLRIYEDVQLNLTQRYTSSSPGAITRSKKGDSTYNLFDTDPSQVVFYIGGYPDDFTPPTPLKLSKYEGCIELATFNERFISLYNFQKAVNVNKVLPCKRYAQISPSLYFEGTGYGSLNISNTDRSFLFIMRSNRISVVRLDKVDIFRALPVHQGVYQKIYIGGLPSLLRERDNITAPPLKGCLRNIQVNTANTELSEKVGISQGCSSDFLVSFLSFSLGSSLSAPLDGFSLTDGMTVSLGFQSTNSEGLLMENSQLDLRVDEDDLGELQPSTSPVAVDNINVTLGRDNFQGCLTIVSAHRCSKTGKPAHQSCLSYSTGPAVLCDPVRIMLLCPRPQFSLDFRTKTANGLLFYVGSMEGKSYLALYLSNGRIRLAVERKQIFIREKFNNGRWHTVRLGLGTPRKIRLVVDGLHAKDGYLTSDEGLSLNLQPPVYLGTVPASWKTLPRESVTGCIRNFKLNGRPMGRPSVNHAAPPCFDGPTESGAYFSGHGGYVVLEDSFVVGLSFELVFEVRPRNLTGVLFHVESPHGHHLSLFMKKGEVTVQVNNGAGQFNVSVMPQQSLCDGTFHRVAVIKRNNVVQLDVDTEGQYTVGPSSAILTDTNDPLYVGGLPGMFALYQHVWRLQLKSQLYKSPYVVAQVSGPVNLRECPAG